jgi:hypothetical protein
MQRRKMRNALSAQSEVYDPEEAANQISIRTKDEMMKESQIDRRALKRDMKMSVQPTKPMQILQSKP